jgi:hypothetical protein
MLRPLATGHWLLAEELRVARYGLRVQSFTVWAAGYLILAKSQ